MSYLAKPCEYPHIWETNARVSTFRKNIGCCKEIWRIIERTRVSNYRTLATALNHLERHPIDDTSNHCFNQLEQYI